MTKFFDTLGKFVDDNLPGLLIVGGSVTILGTIGYSVFAGFKIKEVVENEELDTKTKAKKIAVVSAPIILGATVGVGCNVAAFKEQNKRYAALGTLIAAGAATNKIETVVSEDEIKKVKKKFKKDSDKKVGAPEVMPTEEITIRDEVTGYVFKTTLQSFLGTVSKINNMLDSRPSIGAFYEELLGDRYVPCETHDFIKFGENFTNNTFVAFNPMWDCDLTDDMKPIYTISYDYVC